MLLDIIKLGFSDLGYKKWEFEVDNRNLFSKIGIHIKQLK